MKKEKNTYYFKFGERPVDAWHVDINLMIEADKIIKPYRKYGVIPLWLNKVLHEITWHMGLHTAKWINDNRDLVEKFANYDSLSEDEKEILRVFYHESLKKLNTE